jgi:hypothetical protein
VTLPSNISELFCGLPAESLIRKGLDDLGGGRESVESLLVLIGAPRLRLMNVPVPAAGDIDSDRKLYGLLCESHGSEAYSHYNSLLRQLSSFARALERRYRAAGLKNCSGDAA